MKKIKNKSELSIYIHIPFCVQKCLYCDFLSEPVCQKEMEEYVAALCTEITWYRQVFAKHNIRSIFVGGGTPSLLNESQIENLMDTLWNSMELTSMERSRMEVTIETNPGTLTKGRLDTYLKCGINRLSIGIQSSNDRELKRLGRIHTFKEAVESFYLARQAGFQNINTDLMSGLPGQTMETYLETLERITELNPEHISAYSLIVEEGTPFYHLYGEELGQNLLPGEDLDREMYRKATDFLMKKGFFQYEISNYAKTGYESRHNISYWTGISYLGLGLGASSLYQHKRYHNETNRKQYIAYAAANQNIRIFPDDSFYMPGAAIEEILSVKDQMVEFMILGLRMNQGVSSKDFQKAFGKTLQQMYGKVLADLIQKKLIYKLEEERFALTNRGIDVSNQVFLKFL